jgi:hypothetical protein
MAVEVAAGVVGGLGPRTRISSHDLQTGKGAVLVSTKVNRKQGKFSTKNLFAGGKRRGGGHAGQNNADKRQRFDKDQEIESSSSDDEEMERGRGDEDEASEDRIRSGKAYKTSCVHW